MLLLLPLGAGAVVAAPFDQVPQGDQAYADCQYLAERGLIDARPPSDFAGATPLARYDFTLSLVRPMAALEALAQEGRVGPALEPVKRMSQDERNRVGDILARLFEEFRDVLSMLGKDVTQAVHGARLVASSSDSPSAGVPAPMDNAAGVTYQSARTRVGVIYRASEGDAAGLPLVPLGGLSDAPISGLAASRLPVTRAQPGVVPAGRLASSDISLRRLSGTLEYGVTDNLSLNLAYESMIREGRGMMALDAASLRTLGIGYRLSPSTSVNLKYHLIDYADRTQDGSRLQDQMAETELTVRF
jgi:hypothetical protein